MVAHGLLQTVANASFNPLEPYLASGWNYMTDNYSRFTIAVWISLILNEVRGRNIAKPVTRGPGHRTPCTCVYYCYAGGLLRSLCAWFRCTVPALHAEIQSTTGQLIVMAMSLVCRNLSALV